MSQNRNVLNFHDIQNKKQGKLVRFKASLLEVDGMVDITVTVPLESEDYDLEDIITCAQGSATKLLNKMEEFSAV